MKEPIRLKITEIKEQEMEVLFPMFRKGTANLEGWYFKIFSQNKKILAIGFFPNSNIFEIGMTYFGEKYITETVEITEQEFFDAWNNVYKELFEKLLNKQ